MCWRVGLQNERRAGRVKHGAALLLIVNMTPAFICMLVVTVINHELTPRQTQREYSNHVSGDWSKKKKICFMQNQQRI